MTDMADHITTNQSKLITSNVRKVFAQGMHHLDKRAYTFITLHMGFIAHFGLEGFQREYAQLGRFAVTLLDTETHVIEAGGGRHRNDDWADEVEQRGAPITAITIRAILGVARGAREGAQIRDILFQKTADLEQAGRLADKWGHHVVADEEVEA